MAMFQRDGDDSRETETVIGPSVKVEGNFVGAGNVVVSGTVSGSLKTAKNLRVNAGAKIHADVEAASVSVAGEIRGNVRAKDRLELTASAKIFGNVETQNLSVESGAVLHGKVTMTQSSANTTNAQTPTPAAERESHGRRH
jgi:cytoskeletal protein CcmA (bactofilin family)